MSNGFSTATGTCTGQLQFRQNTAAPHDKKIVRLKIGSLATGLKARTSTASTAAAHTGCTLPTTGMTGAYLIFTNP